MEIDINLLPLIESIEYQSPQILFDTFADTPWNMLLDGAGDKGIIYGTNRYSYILIDPFKSYIYDKLLPGDDPLLSLRQKMHPYRAQTVSDLPPFQGGLAGYLSYDLTHIYYPVSYPCFNDMNTPDLCVGFYDLVCSFDHVQKKTFLISTGWPEQNPSDRLKRAQGRLKWFKNAIIPPKTNPRVYNGIINNHISSNFTKVQYIKAVKKIVDYIQEGDIFEANLAQRFSAELANPHQSYALYQQLCAINPSPFSAFLNLGIYKIISASPERFIQVQNRCIETRPIKGTCARHSDAVQDQFHITALLNSEKDIAENIMIVDLMRNDLSKVCEDDSVIVTQLCGHEAYPTVHHLVSVIQGRLRDAEDVFSLLKAAFPGGSITGAPKIRAMQIIAEMEPHQRGPYCGNIVLIGFDGYMDSSIIIRTFVLKENKVTFHAGGAVVIESDPSCEYEETLMKAQALHRALSKDKDDFIN